MLGRLRRARRVRRLERRLAGRRLLDGFADAYPEAVFVEIGSNDGEQHDHLRPLIVSRSWRGVMVEPVPFVFERLRANYGQIERVALDNVAIGDRDGSMPFFHLREAAPGERDQLPSWYDGIGSFDRAHLSSHAEMVAELESRVVSTDVPTLTFESLCHRHGLERIDLVLIDAEGYDARILAQVDFAAHAPRLIVYEHYHLDSGEREGARLLLGELGYELLEEGFDTWCLRPDDDRLTEIWRTLQPAIPAASAAEDRADPPALELHDESVPLPPGAVAQLRPENPRLLELRRAYARLELPVVGSPRWSPSAVDAFLDLRWFRGETLITWHYREQPGATEHKFAKLHEYVAAGDELGLLSRLEEDGAFGCWTYSVAGRTVSRDLLESVNEINYLERRLGLSAREGLRVLDIGAGYGRLAHRMARAIPHLRDYCCVDAIPESTFVCEYYLGYRGVSPPARVAALDRIDSELTPGGFDLAVNIHSFSECTHAAIEWWLGVVARLRVANLLIVPNEPTELLSLESDGSRRDFAGLPKAAGYALVARDRVFDDPALREIVGLDDHFHLYELRG
jgi:FkbM family methyltransferase